MVVFLEDICDILRNQWFLWVKRRLNLNILKTFTVTKNAVDLLLGPLLCE